MVVNQSGFENYGVRPPESLFVTTERVGALKPTPFLTSRQTDNAFVRDIV
jgi:hypothetical protein